MLRYIVIPAIIISVLFGVSIISDKALSQMATDHKEEKQEVSDVEIGGAFSLINQEGKEVKSSDFSGKLMLVYFGFTSCPDICPTDLMEITSAMQKLGEGSSSVQPIFITIDPERDNQERMKEFSASFYPGLQALTGTNEQIADIAGKYRIFYQKVEADKLKEYTMNHSGYIYLMGKDGKYITHFRHGQKAEEIVAGVQKYL